jgi:signal transduction histidine kinase
LVQIDECRITSLTSSGEKNYEFGVHSKPIEWDGKRAAFLALNDASDGKRREALEKTFFHDVLNTAASVQGLAELLALESGAMSGAEHNSMLETLRDGCRVLTDEIRNHQMLLAAERGQLPVQFVQTSASVCAQKAVSLARHWPASEGKTILLGGPANSALLWTDPILLGRVLTNLLKNAVEATHTGGEVRIETRQCGDWTTFEVWNAGIIAPQMQLRVFERSVSTKGPGRGIGTYSVRLFAESYLGGKVSFTSSKQNGTSFLVDLPTRALTQTNAG